MYSKKINQLATNLNPQNDDLLPIGDAETGQLKTTTFGSVSGITGDGVISGGIVTWTGTGLNFNISACTYILNGVRYTSPFTTKTLAAADPTNPRIDVFAVNTSGQVEVIQGTPNANPVEPEGDTPTTLGLTNVTINAGATTPNNVTRDLIYDENVESWTKTISVGGGTTYNLEDTAFAYTGTKSILATMGAGFIFFNFSKAVAMDISNYKSLSFAIRLNTAWTSNTILSVRFYNGANTVSNLFQINATNNVGFNRNLAGQWQLITIPFNNTNLRFTNNAFTTIRIQTSNAAVTYRLDTIQLNGGINNPGGGTTPSNSFGFVNGTTGTASSTTATDTLNVVGSGLITTSATGKTLTIASNQIATGSILGRVTAGTGNIETLTGTQATTLLDVFTSSLKGLAPASGGGTTNFLRADGTWAAAGGGTTIYTGDGTLTSARTLTHGGFNLSFVGSSFTNRFTSAGRLLLGTTTESTFILDVNGTARFTDNLTFTFPSAGVKSIGWGGNTSAAAANPLIYSDSNYLAINSKAGSRLYFNFDNTNASSLVDFFAGKVTISKDGVIGGSSYSFSENLNLSKNHNSSTKLIITNTTSGTNSVPVLQFTSDTSSGNFSFGKNSTTTTSYKIISSKNGYLFNDSTGGDIAILNDVTSGKIKFAAGGSSTSQVEISSGGTLSIGTSSPNASAITQIDSTSKGFLPPRMTTTQKNAIGTPAAGLIVYDTDTNKLCCYNGTTWNDLF
jgi:hypothetical protein